VCLPKSYSDGSLCHPTEARDDGLLAKDIVAHGNKGKAAVAGNRLGVLWLFLETDNAPVLVHFHNAKSLAFFTSMGMTHTVRSAFFSCGHSETG